MLSADTWQQAMTGRIDFKTVFMPFCSSVSRRGRKFYNIINNCTGRHSTAFVEELFGQHSGHQNSRNL